MQRQFEPENQEATYFTLGLAVTLLGAMIAIVATRRRRGRMRRELHAIERAAANGGAATRNRALLGRRAHVRGLHLDGRIDEAQLKVLEDRIDELARGGRMADLEARFDFLPFGFVKQVQEMLADGRLSGWEHDQLDRLLAADGSLSAVQKNRVRGLLGAWAKEDAA